VSESAGGLLILCVFTEHGQPTDFGFEQLSGHDPVSGQRADYQRMPSHRNRCSIEVSTKCAVIPICVEND